MTIGLHMSVLSYWGKSAETYRWGSPRGLTRVPFLRCHWMGRACRQHNYALWLKNLDIQLWKRLYRHTSPVLYNNRLTGRHYGQTVGAEHASTIWHCVWLVWHWAAKLEGLLVILWSGDGQPLINEVVSFVTVPRRNGRLASVVRPTML